IRLHCLGETRVKPSDSDQDACVAAIFLVIAQEHFYPTPESKRKTLAMREFHDLTLRLLTMVIKQQGFILYAAHMTKGFLQECHDPFKTPLRGDNATVSGMTIKYTRVPAWPVLGPLEWFGTA
ncbi:hypothetical protein B0T10DRAFT_378351, partial [Thelonectria olida]